MNVSDNVKAFPGEHGHVFQSEAQEIHAQECFQHVYTPQSHGQN